MQEMATFLGTSGAGLGSTLGPIGGGTAPYHFFADGRTPLPRAFATVNAFQINAVSYFPFLRNETTF
jgi:hypothetical protein